MLKKTRQAGMRNNYTPDDIQKAAQVFAVTGNMIKTAEMVNIPRETLQYWKKNKAEWVQETTRVHQEKLEELDAHYTEIVELTALEVKDRVQNGDEFYDPKTGEMYRKKMSGRDLAMVNGIIFDKQRLLRGLPTSNVQQSSAKHLEELAKIFEDIANKGRAKVIEGDAKRVDD
jgi:fructose-specific phosphotransferase system component IIB